VVLVDGVVQQIGTPDDVFAKPANVRVARLIGDPAMNVVGVRITGGARPMLTIGEGVAAPISQDFFDRIAPHARDGRVSLGLRPSMLRVVPADAEPAGADRLPVTVYAVEPLGKFTLVSVEAGGERIRVKTAADSTWRPGQPVLLALDAAAVLCFDAESGALLMS